MRRRPRHLLQTMCRDTVETAVTRANSAFQRERNAGTTPRLRRTGENRGLMEHPTVIQPGEHAEFRADKMGKTTLFESNRLLVGLNAFEPGQSHALHSHTGMDKVYQVVHGRGVFL